MSGIMSLATRKLLFWSAFFLALGGLVWLLGDVLLPFVLGIAIAYLLNPVCEWLSRRGLPRAVATSLVLGLFAFVALLLLALLTPVLISQVTGFALAVPGYVDHLRDTLQPHLTRFMHTLQPEDFERLRAAVGEYAGRAAQTALDVLGGLWLGGAAVLNVLALLLVTPVVAFYLLRDWPRLLARIDSWLPRSKAAIIREQFRAIDRTLAGFVRGQSMVCAILAAYYSIALALLGLNFGLVIGLLAGLLSFIPFVGSTFGLVAAVIVALVQFDGYTQVSIVLGLFLFAQFMEGNVLSPRLIGESVGLHPVWIIFALMAGGALFGFVGMLMAIPAAAVLGVLVRFSLKEYLASAYYHGGTGRMRRVRPL